jgi:hypothetical protein
MLSGFRGISVVKGFKMPMQSSFRDVSVVRDWGQAFSQG